MFVITTTDVATPENADKVIVLTVNRSDISDVSFAITGGADKAKFSLSEAGGFKGKCVATKAEFSLISATSNRKIYTPLAGSKCNYFGYIFWRRNISCGNDKLFCFFCNFDRKFLIDALNAIANSDGDSHIANV
jgi:hypothetical protein